jgi:hypothetical protein
VAADAYRVELLPRGEWAVWERLLARCPQANPFASPEWLEPLARATSAEVEVVLCRQGEEPAAGYAAFVRRGRLGFTARLAPTTPYNTVAIVPRACREPHRAERHELDVLRAIRAHAMERYDYVRFVHHPALRDIRAFEWDTWRAAVFYTHRLRFGAGRDPLAGIGSDVQRRAGQAERAGICVRLEERVDDFYTLWLRTCERQRLRLQLPAKAYFHLFRHLRGRGQLEVRLARSPSGAALAGNLVVREGAAAYLWMAAANPEQFDSGANQLLLRETIVSLAGQVELFDLCGAFCPSIAQYKSTAGGELTPYYTVWRASGRRARGALAARDLLLGLGLRQGGFW